MCSDMPPIKFKPKRKQDKKAEAGGVTFVLVRSLGEAFVAKGVDRSRLLSFLLSEGALA